MKKLTLLTFFMTFALISCSTEEIESEQQKKHLNRTTKEVAHNSNNPFDYVGKAFGDVLLAYENANFSENDAISIKENVQAIANAHPDFTTLNPSGQFVITDSQMITNIINGTYDLESAINAAALTENAKVTIVSFMNHLKTQIENQPASSVFDSIVVFENSVLNQNNLTSKDVRLILSSSSILRFSIINYSFNDPEKDWKDIKTLTTASLYGFSTAGETQGILAAAVVIVLQENNN
jgi:hypothetical protein